MKTDKPPVTITITMYNNPEGLEKTVPSIISQDYDNAEIIISDDGSTKYDKAILEKYADMLREKYPEVRINLLEQNVGTVKHVNKAFALAKGKYIFDLSPGDFFYSSDVVSSIVNQFEKTGKMIITSRRADVYDDGHEKIRPGVHTGFLLKFFPKQLLNYMLTKKNVLSGCGTFYSRKLFDECGMFDEQYKLVEDYTYYVMILYKGISFGWTSKVTVGHEMGGVSNGDVHPLVYQDIELLKKNYGVLR